MSLRCLISNFVIHFPQLVLVFVMLMAHDIYCQQVPSSSYITQRSLTSLAASGTKGGEFLFGIGPTYPGTEGSFYLNLNWNKSSFTLKKNEKEIQGFHAKYDLRNSVLEILTTTDIKVVDITKVLNLTWIDSITSKPQFFINAEQFTINETKLLGFLEILVDGKTSLFKHTSIFVQPPNYNVALNSGSKNNIIKKKEKYYLSMDRVTLVEIKGKKSLMKELGDISETAEKIIRENSLSLSREEDLVKLLTEINSIQKK